jgi:hypothetical protein
MWDVEVRASRIVGYPDNGRMIVATVESWSGWFFA